MSNPDREAKIEALKRLSTLIGEMRGICQLHGVAMVAMVAEGTTGHVLTWHEVEGAEPWVQAVIGGARNSARITLTDDSSGSSTPARTWSWPGITDEQTGTPAAQLAIATDRPGPGA